MTNIQEAHQIVSKGIERHITAEGKHLTVICILLSGGNDSMVLTHLFKDIADYAVHVNTGIGIPDTNQFVRDICQVWGISLIEKSPPLGSTYRELVLDQGFPGPGHHYKMYQRLKERALREVRREFIGKQGRKKRIIFLAGRRRHESKRRMYIPESERDGAIVWLSPLVNWTNEEMLNYRVKYDLPVNQVTRYLHMSGECLCGAFAQKGEREEIALWYPLVDKRISKLEDEVRRTGIPEPRCRWGWGCEEKYKRKLKGGALCSTCNTNYDLFEEAIA